MTRFFLRIYDFLKSHSVASVLIGVAVVVLSLLLARTLHYAEDISEFLPSNPQSEKYSEIYNALGRKNNIIILFRGEDRFEIEEAMEVFSDAFDSVDKDSLVKERNIFAEGEDALEAIGFLLENAPYFLTEKDYKRADSLLSVPQYIENTLREDKDRIALSSGSLTTGMIKADPLHLFTPLLSRMRDNGASEGYTVSDGCIFTPDGTGLGFLTSPFGMSESGKNSLVSSLVSQAVDSVAVRCPNVKVSAVGGPLIAASNASQIKRDSVVVISLALLLILLLLFISYRKPKDILWVFLSVAFGWIFALGVMALLRDSISIIIIGIGSVIIGIAVNYPLHFMDILKEGKPVRDVLKEMVAPLLVGNITTVAAFLCLVWLDAVAMRDFGLFGALTLAGTILFVLILLPQYAKAHEPTPMRVNIGKILPDKAIRSPWVLAFVVVMTLVLGYFSRGVKFDSDMNNINYMTPSQRSDLGYLSSVGKSSSLKEFYVVAQGASLDEAMEIGDSLRDVLGSVPSVKGPLGLLPGKEEQKRRLGMWKEFKAKHPTLSQDIGAAAVKEGFSAKAFDKFTSMLSKDFTPRTASHFSPIVKMFEGSSVLSTDGKVSLVTRAYGKEGLTPEVRSNQRDGVLIFDSSDVGNSLVNTLSDSFDYIGTVCSLVVFVFLLLSFRRVETALLAFIPLAVSWVWILGTMNIFGICFNIVNIILATFIFGQGDDYTIFITEGLMYEYAYKRKRMVTYKNSVLVSALIMFIGIGALIVAKHPAMRSLAQVTIIGMLIVVLMSYYIPPLIFGFLTQKEGKDRDVPITLGRILRSLFAMTAVLVILWLFAYPYTFFHFLGGKSEEKQIRYRKFLQKIAAWMCRHIPGVKCEFANTSGETFEKPSIVVCNHQSHLDLACLMALSPKLVFVTNHWVWHNPIYGYILRKAEFYPMEKGIPEDLSPFKDYINRGYSIVIFPEGTRTVDGEMGRFHQGAFVLSRELGVDIVPVFIHGAYDVLPKKDFMLRKGNLYCEVGSRIPCPSEGTTLEVAKGMRQFYKREYSRIRDERETPLYWAPYVRYKYMYKGADTEAACRKDLGTIPDWVGRKDGDTKTIKSCGIGTYALLYALCHRDVQVYASDPDPDNIALASNISYLPANLHYEIGE